jgi:hypothetical protein
MKRLHLAILAIGALASCYYEPPREYTVPVYCPTDNVIAETTKPWYTPADIIDQCANLSCDGDFAVSGRISASSFLEGAPLIVDGAANVTYTIPVNSTTVIVYPNNSPTAIELPLSTEAPGRIVRIKVMGIGGVNIKGHLDPMTNQPENIDNAPSALVQSSMSAPPPAVTLQAYYDEFVPPGAPHRSGWAVLSVYP